MPLFGKKAKTPNLAPQPAVTRMHHVNTPDVWIYWAVFVNEMMPIESHTGPMGDGWTGEAVPMELMPGVKQAIFAEHSRNHKWQFTIGTARDGQWSKWELPGDPPPVPEL
jgi:hypothetical protein